jgi:hypothetical protein
MRLIIGYLSITLVLGCGFFFHRIELPYTRNGKYSTYDFKGQKVFIAPIFRGNIFVSNAEDATDDFGGKLSADELVTRNYLPIFLDTMKKSISGKDVVVMSDSLIRKYEDWTGLASKEVELDVGDRHLLTKFRIPDKTSLEKFGFKDDILIIIEQLAFNRNSVQTGYAGGEVPITKRVTYSYQYDYMETKESASLGAKAKVIIWNYRENDGILYGIVPEKTVFRLAMQRKHWDESAASLSKKIIRLAKWL